MLGPYKDLVSNVKKEKRRREKKKNEMEEGRKENIQHTHFDKH